LKVLADNKEYRMKLQSWQQEAIKSQKDKEEFSIDYIDFEKFNELLLNYSDYITFTTERIKYIPYIYFKLKPQGPETQKNCILIMMKSSKDLTTFVANELLNNENFYIIDKEFWESWKVYVNWDNQEINNNDQKLQIPVINIKALLEGNKGKLKQGLIYLKHYILVTSQ
jgi:hypothetical protein